jgi:hypothetical protein
LVAPEKNGQYRKINGMETGQQKIVTLS